MQGATRQLRVLFGFMNEVQIGEFFDLFPELLHLNSTREHEFAIASRSSRSSLTKDRWQGRTTRLALNRTERLWIRRLRQSDEHFHLYTPPLSDDAFGVFDLRELIAIQQWIYPDQLTTPGTTELEVLKLCSRWDEVPEPIVNERELLFAAKHKQAPRLAGVQITRISGGEVRICARVVSAPNYMRVVPFRNRYLLTNGYHRALSLLRQGLWRVLCLVGGNAQEVCAQPGFLSLESVDRWHPMLSDYFVPSHSYDVAVRDHSQGLQVRFWSGQRLIVDLG